MASELKIVMKRQDNQPLTTGETIVYLDDVAIGCIQDIKIRANAYQVLPEIEITFPNYRAKSVGKTDGILMKEIDNHVAALSQFPNIKIVMKDPFAGVDDAVMIEEVGTDGVIDTVKTNW